MDDSANNRKIMESHEGNTRWCVSSSSTYTTGPSDPYMVDATTDCAFYCPSNDCADGNLYFGTSCFLTVLLVECADGISCLTYANICVLLLFIITTF